MTTHEPKVRGWLVRASRRLGLPGVRTETESRDERETEVEVNRRFGRDVRDTFIPNTSGGHGFQGVTRVTEGGRFVATDEVERFWSQVDTSGGPDACWPWLGACDQQRYGQYRVKRDGRGWVTVRAHRYAWELAHGLSLPRRVTLDHECHTRDRSCTPGVTCPHRRCMNSAHMAPVTAAENSRRRHARLRSAL